MIGTATTLDCAIAIPVHNALPWLHRCLEAAIAQPVRWILILDDGSTDGSLGAIEQWAKRDRRILMQSHSIAQGACHARNRLQDWARAIGVEWLQFVDADDWLLTGKIQRQIAAAQPESEILWCDLVRFECDRFPPRRKVMRFLDATGYGFPPNPGCWLIRPRVFDRLPDLRWDDRFRACRNDLDWWMCAQYMGARLQRTPFVGLAYRAFWGEGQLTQNPAWHEHQILESKYPSLLAKQPVIETKVTADKGLETRAPYPYDCPSTGADPIALVELPTYTRDHEADWAKLLAVLRRLHDRRVPLRLVIRWPHGGAIDRLRGKPVRDLSFCSHRPHHWDLLIQTGDEPLPGRPVPLFDPPVGLRKNRDKANVGPAPCV